MYAYIFVLCCTYIYGPGLQAPPHPPPPKGLGAQGSICTGGAGLLQVVFPPPPPVGWGGVSVCTCMYGCMYVFVCKYVCVYL